MVRAFRLSTSWLPCLELLVLTTALAGPPFQTDDPEPVEPRHWEVYLGAQYANNRGAPAGTCPQVEVNYGAAPNVQLHLIAPLAFAGGPPRVGFGDVDLGAKVRLVQEGPGTPMVGIFPHVFIPTGDAGHGLGFGRPQVQLPVWLQRSWGPWTTYGGGGLQFNFGRGNRNSWLAGWEVQRDVSRRLTLGGELFYTTSTAAGASDSLSFNAGGQWNFDDEHHLLFSAGRGLGGPNLFSAYVAFQWTLGPGKKG